MKKRITKFLETDLPITSYTRVHLGYFLIGGAILFITTFIYVGIYLPIDSEVHGDVRFHIEAGERSYTIASNLQTQGFIRSRVLFTFYALMRGELLHLQSGDYFLAPSMSSHAILKKLAVGDIISEAITIQEGWNLRDMAEAFEQKGLFSTDQFFEITGFPGIDYRVDETVPQPKDFSSEFEFLKSKPEYVSLEGYLSPDTYQLSRKETPERIVRRMLKNFEDKVIDDNPELTGDITFFEILTMASIIEKEVRSLEDKKIVSGVLWKRLANNMRLQVDATVVYIREGNYKIVSIDETKTDSPYNTYTNDGLPPGPISNPGLESIQAALEPTESPYWFYLSPSANTTVFTRTFEEHKAAKALYLP